MLILGNYKGNYDTATTTAIKSMGFDLNVTQSNFSYKYFLTESGQHLMLVPNKRRKRSKFMYIVLFSITFLIPITFLKGFVP